MVVATRIIYDSNSAIRFCGDGSLTVQGFFSVRSKPYANMRPTDDLFIRPGEIRFHQCQRSYELSWQRRWTDENTSPARFCLCGLLTFVKKQREASLQATLLFGYPLPKFPW